MKVKWKKAGNGFKSEPYEDVRLYCGYFHGRAPFLGYIIIGHKSHGSRIRRRTAERAKRDAEELAEGHALSAYTASADLCRTLGVEIDDDE